MSIQTGSCVSVKSTAPAAVPKKNASCRVGILRLRYRNSQEKPELANPGETYHITVDLWATSNVFLAGHKLRLQVSSSNFPRFDRNLNTGEEQARGTRMIKAINVIYHDKLRPSALVVPVP